jgi:serine/threonine protein kinase
VRHRSALENQLKLVGEGHYGKVYRVLGYRMKASPDTPLAYKEYIPDPAGAPGESHSRGMVEKTVEFWKKMASEKPLVRDEIGRYFAWPWEIVKDYKADGSRDLEVCGFLMPLAQEDFFWQAGRPSGRVRSLDWLASPESFWQRNEVEAVMSQVTLADRLLLMTQLAFAFAVLHRQGWVIGDFSYQNAAFALDPPRVLLIDCDDAASLSDPDRQQPHTPNWYPPECQGAGAREKQDHKTDVYKLGLAIVRYLKPEDGATTTFEPERLASILDPRDLDLIRSALSEDRKARPTAREIFEYLKRITDPMIASPVINYAELITPVVLRDADGQATGRIAWQIAKADKIDIFLGEDQPQAVRTVTPADYPGGCAFPVTESGQVTLVATNHYGERRCVVGDITVFDIPPITVNFSQMPRLDLPVPPEMPFDPAQVAFPGGVPAIPEIPDEKVPDVEIPQIQVPDGSLPEFEDLLWALTPDGVKTPSPSGIADAVRAGVQSQVQIIRAESDRFEGLLLEKVTDRMRADEEVDYG